MEAIVERLFNGEESWLTPATEFLPRANVAETEAAYEVTLDVPGMTAKDISVEVRDGSLWISGEKSEEKEEKGKWFHRVERQHGAFRRTFPLELPVDRDKVEATYMGGVLIVRVPKVSAPPSKKIEVKG